MELFRFKKLTEATSGTAIEHDKYRYIKCRNACGSPPGDVAAAQSGSQTSCSVTTEQVACPVSFVHSWDFMGRK